MFILIIMVLSAFGMWEASRSNKEEYNGFEFTLTENSWLTEIAGKQYAFDYLPSELEQLNVTKVAVSGEKVYIAYDPEDKAFDKTYAINYIGSLFYQKNIRPVLACTKEKDCPAELPIVACDTASADVIFIRSGNETRISKDFRCYIVQAKDNLDLGMLRQRIAYSVLGVMD